MIPGMTLPGFEPANDDDVRRWQELANDVTDPFFTVREASDRHREAHGCDVFPSGNGQLLGLLARLARPSRVLEVGCGLGYSALWLARGAGPGAPVLTVEAEPGHAALAREQLASFDEGAGIQVVEGPAADLLSVMSEPVDLAYFDADPAGSLTILGHLERLLPPGGLLICSNLFLARYVPDATWVDELAECRQRLADATRWDTVWLGKAVSVRKG